MRHWARWYAAAAVVTLVAATACSPGGGGGGGGGGMAGGGMKMGPSPNTMVTGDMLQKAASSGDWLMYGHNYWNNRFSPLSAINASNVKNLVPRMVLQTGTEKLGSFETTPVVVNGIMYVTTPVTPTNDVMAYDLRQGGKMLWRYTHKTGQNSFGVACCGPNNRGVAVANGALFLGTLDGQLIALDQQTGKEKWATHVGDPAFGYTETMAPLVIGDKVSIGTSGAEYGIRGFVKAYNAANGQLAWTWYTLPAPEEGGWWGKWSKTTWEGEDLHRDLAKAKADSAQHKDAGRTGAVDVGGAGAGTMIREGGAFVPPENMFGEPTAKGVRMLPGANGGEEWSPVAIRPDLASAYAVGLRQPMDYITPSAP